MPGVTGLMVYDPTGRQWVNAQGSPSGVLLVSGGPAGSSSSIAVTNIVTVVTGAQPLAVSGALSISNFPATQPVSGPLTEAQLRGSPLAVTLGGGLTPSSTFVAGTVTAVGPLTDAQLRALAVPVSGTVTANTGLSQPLTDAQLRASPLAVTVAASAPNSTFVAGSVSLVGTSPVSGPVTDAQLRAAPVPVSVQASSTARGLYALGSCVVSGAAETVLIAPGGSSVFHDLVMFTIANSHSTIPARLMIRGALGSSVLMTVQVPPNGSVTQALTRCLEAPGRNMAWTAQKAAVGGSCYLTAQAVKIV